jgi:hypothetical protein
MITVSPMLELKGDARLARRNGLHHYRHRDQGEPCAGNDSLSRFHRVIPLEILCTLLPNAAVNLCPALGRHSMETRPMDKSSTALPVLNRRKVLAGAGAVGAVGVMAAAALPGAAPEPAKTAEARPDAAGGYQLTEHVKQYYATARI